VPTKIVPLHKAERTEYGVTEIVVPVGTKVDLGGQFVATITLAGKQCDCGKGVLCPLNPQERK